MLAAPIEHPIRSGNWSYSLEELVPIIAAASIKVAARPIHQCYPGYSFPDTLALVHLGEIFNKLKAPGGNGFYSAITGRCRTVKGGVEGQQIRLSSRLRGNPQRHDNDFK